MADTAVIQIWGAFRMFGADGIDWTPSGQKTRALMAILVMTAGRRCSRARLMGLLWPDSPPERAATSLRRALSDLRADLGDLRPMLVTDRTGVHLEGRLRIGDRPAGARPDDLLADLVVGSDAFDDWLRAQRAGFSDSPQVRGTIDPVPAVPEIVIICRTLGDARARFGVAHFASTLIGVLLGQSDVPIREGGDDAPPRPEDLVLALDALETETGLHLVVRLLGPPAHRICWTGRHDLTTVAGADDWPERIRFANRIADQALLHLPVGPGRHGRVIGSAVRRIHSYRSAELEGAAVMLRGVVHDVDAGPLGRALALAWGSFATLTRVLEFRDTANSQIEQAVAAVDEAIRLAPAHPLVLALASQVVLRLGQDTDRAITLAARAMRADGDDPYALDVQSTALSLLGRRAEAERMAETARLAAAGRFNSFCWDMQACLTALAAGDLLRAQESARQAHRAEPGYRPALRYLLAIAMLRGDRDEAAVARTRLQRIEHDFRPTALIDPAYPMHTLHFLGLNRDLARLIGDTA